MKLKGLNDYDICNYKLPSMFLIFPTCSFKCDKECGRAICQNSALANESEIEIDFLKIIHRYLENPLTQAIVCGGLEPFDSWPELYSFCSVFRGFSSDPIVIYTGYKEEEISYEIKLLSQLPNIIIKFGRFIPNSLHIFDALLGVELASNNQYAKNISEMNFNGNLAANSGENKIEEYDYGK